MRSYRRAYFFSGFVKHASLVNKVYPPKPPLDGSPAVPNGSELAYLVFYAQHRPEKLAKVGRYLQKRVLWDLSHNRKWCHPVSLATLDSLLDACPTYTPYFAARIVRILTELLNAIEAEAAGIKVTVAPVSPEDADDDDGSVPGDAASDTTPATGTVFPSTLRDLLPAVTATWIRLNTHYDGSLDTDAHFATPFHALVERFCRMSVVPPTTSPKPIARKRTLLRRRRKRSIASADSTTGSMRSSTASLPIARAGDPAMAKTLVGALRSMAHSPALFRSPLAATYTAHLIPVLVANVQPDLDGELDEPDAEIARSRSPSASSAGGASTVDSALAAHSVTSLALAAVQRLVASAPATSVSAVLAHLCDAMDAQGVWRDAGRTDLLLSSILAAASSPAQTLLLDQLLTRTADGDVLRALSSAPFAPGCLAVSLHDVVNAVMAAGDAGAPVLAHVTRTVGASAPRDVLGAVLAPGVSPRAACAVLDVVQSDLVPVTLAQVEPVIALLSDADAEVRSKAAAVVAAAGRAPGATAQRNLAARVADALGKCGDEEEVVKAVVAAHVDSARDWAAVVELTSDAARPVVAAGLRDAVARGAPWTEPIVDLVSADSDIDWTALTTALRDAAAAEVADADDALLLAAAPSEGTLQRLYKSRPTIQFGPLPEITRATGDVVPAGEEVTVDEFQAILAGKKVAVRPVSMGGEWASVRMSMLSLDAVLDRVCGDVTSDGESVQSE
ncbi:hypothetical protein AMAG_09258 [Allomyces macrogynus ATCC 38327]|uniref:Uncharacterized protein n=1 Tax=Allomyces macrogynus (strain ATCC 38327) TaxID=578462 RepID=A0A0L0SPB2_ALLM3|nr:hypothetical protein AMAG_09258 [Allomyces macrogynus ATCC 38327]|eukprot:KNE64215.1 hypothetical protein AMAG_09258 [Allomyces macrogynus ATCC 38327]